MRWPNGRTSWGELKRLAAIETDECVVWPYATAGQRGYGLTYAPGGEKRYCHREALLRRSSPPSPEKRYAIHGPCNNPLCMNYRHLSWGTPSQNNLDRRRDGTAPLGEANGIARLTERDVKRIRDRYKQGDISQEQLASQYGVATMTVNRAIRGISWSHI